MDIELEKIQTYISEILHADISEVLYNHKCYDLIIRLPNSAYYDKACQRYMSNKQRMERFLHECQPILEQMKMPYVIVKGVVLSQTAYGEAYIRHSGDMDILVAPQDISTFNRIMKTNNFVQGTISNGCIIPASREKRVYQTFYSHQLLPFIKKTDSKICPYICIDANTNVIWGESKNKLDMQELLSHREKLKIEDIELYKLDAINEFIVLCLHHFKDMNSIYLLSQGSLKLKLFLDIYRYIQHQRSNLPIDMLYNRVAELGLLPYIYYCLEQTAQLFPNQVLQSYSESFKNAHGEMLLNKFGLADDEQKIWKMPLEERLFSSDFLEKFYEMLDEDDIKKINLNIRMMQ